MRKSLIESIGRESAIKLIDSAVLQAIEENDCCGVFRKTKKAQVVDGALCTVEVDLQGSLVAGPSPVSRLLNKKVPIA
jgi:hypothetical protein